MMTIGIVSTTPAPARVPAPRVVWAIPAPRAVVPRIIPRIIPRIVASVPAPAPIETVVRPAIAPAQTDAVPAPIPPQTVGEGWESIGVEPVNIHIPIPRSQAIDYIPVERTADADGKARIAEADDTGSILIVAHCTIETADPFAVQVIINYLLTGSSGGGHTLVLSAFCVPIGRRTTVVCVDVIDRSHSSHFIGAVFRLVDH
jgi:hypothetical protein